MERIEQGKILWDDPNGLWKTRMDGRSHAFLGQNRGGHGMGDTAPHFTHQDRSGNRRHNRVQPVVKEFTCSNYNANYCKEQGDHMDPSLPHKYMK